MVRSSAGVRSKFSGSPYQLRLLCSSPSEILTEPLNSRAESRAIATPIPAPTAAPTNGAPGKAIVPRSAPGVAISGASTAVETLARVRASLTALERKLTGKPNPSG